jgi:hypothetical protein
MVQVLAAPGHAPGRVGKRGQLVLLLAVGFAAIGSIVELFVRLVLDPALEHPEAEIAHGALSQHGFSQVPADVVAHWSFTGGGLTASLKDSAFYEIQCVVAMLVCVVTGLGMEFFIGYEFLAGSERITQWHEHAWFVAQFLFPIMLLCAVQLARVQNALALIFGVAGMWKFGFPETLLCLLHGYHSDSEGRGALRRLQGFLDGFGFLAHHSASMLFICVMCFGLSPMTKPLVTCVTPLILQHLVISFKYFSIPMYAVAEFLLEIFWESNVFSAIELLYLPHGVPLSAAVASPMHTALLRRVFCAMLIAHWLYWTAALLGVIADAAQPKPHSSHQDVRPAESWQGSEVSSWQGKLRKYAGGSTDEGSVGTGGGGQNTPNLSAPDSSTRSGGVAGV